MGLSTEELVTLQKESQNHCKPCRDAPEGCGRKTSLVEVWAWVPDSHKKSNQDFLEVRIRMSYLFIFFPVSVLSDSIYRLPSYLVDSKMFKVPICVKI